MYTLKSPNKHTKFLPSTIMHTWSMCVLYLCKILLNKVSFLPLFACQLYIFIYSLYTLYKYLVYSQNIPKCIKFSSLVTGKYYTQHSRAILLSTRKDNNKFHFRFIKSKFWFCVFSYWLTSKILLNVIHFSL